MRTAAAITAVIIVSLTGWGCAFAGSTPPVAPHSAMGIYEDCRSCHEDGTQGAPRTDHAKKPECTSCHHTTQPAP